jgi:type II secretory pathway pseudopilin PulG
LLEILVSVAILASVLTGIMLMLSYSIKSDSEAKMRTVAKDLIQEGTDIFRRERDRLGWSTVYDQITELPYNEFCLNEVLDEPADDNIFNDLSMGDSCSFGINVDGASQPFKRVASVSWIADQEIKVIMTVSWEDDRGGNDHFISSTLLLKPW